MHFITLATAASAAFAGVSAIVIPGRHLHVARHDKPATYAEGYLEPYQTYHTRYLAIDCESQHNTTFFDKCCHPMLATETLAKNRAAECNPANLASSTASSASATATQVLSSGSDDEDCDSEDEDDSSDDEDCDDEDTSSAAAPASTSTPISTSTTHSATPTTSTHTTSTHATTTQAPVTSTTETPTSTHKTSTTQKATSTSSSASSSSTSTGGDDDFSGNATFFFQGGVAGACGTVHQDTDFVAALQTKLYGNLNAKSTNCGRKIKLTNTNNGKSVTVTVADACPTCEHADDLDLSQAAFDQIATEKEGEVPITWSFLD